MEPSHEQEGLLLDVETKNSVIWRVRSGFYTCDEIVTTAAESITDETLGITSQRAKRAARLVVAAEWVAQLGRQQAWPPEPTISDKLAKAFSSLERNHKILARMNFTCCQTCGVEEISEDRDEDSRGYVFFHEQDTKCVISGRDLLLAFGSFTKSEKKTRDVGDIIVRSLRRAGLRVEWKQDTGSRIIVRCAEWRRRFEEGEDMEDVGDDDFDSDCMSGSESELEPEPDTDSDLDLGDALDTTGQLV
ncbi:hypothetical protein ACJZ2D_017096 [Fusarium nematophilum]